MKNLFLFLTLLLSGSVIYAEGNCTTITNCDGTPIVGVEVEFSYSFNNVLHEPVSGYTNQDGVACVEMPYDVPADALPSISVIGYHKNYGNWVPNISFPVSVGGDDEYPNYPSTNFVNFCQSKKTFCNIDGLRLDDLSVPHGYCLRITIIKTSGQYCSLGTHYNVVYSASGPNQQLPDLDDGDYLLHLNYECCDLGKNTNGHNINQKGSVNYYFSISSLPDVSFMWKTGSVADAANSTIVSYNPTVYDDPSDSREPTDNDVANLGYGACGVLFNFIPSTNISAYKYVLYDDCNSTERLYESPTLTSGVVGGVDFNQLTIEGSQLYFIMKKINGEPFADCYSFCIEAQGPCGETEAPECRYFTIDDANYFTGGNGDGNNLGLNIQENSDTDVFSTVEDLLIYPNPSSDKITLSSETELSNIEIYNSNGQMIYSSGSINAQKLDINVQSYAKGVYILKATDINGNKEVTKLMIH